MEPYQQEIRRLIRDNKVQRLFHFTPIENVPSILKHGFLSVPELKKRQIEYVATDGKRLDGYPDWLSFSVHSINFDMFAAKRKDRPRGWAILGISADVMFTQDCRFCWRNAASTEIRGFTNFIGGPWALCKMFGDAPVSAIDSRSRRDVYNIPDYLPTYNDAEVQVFHSVPAEMIEHIQVEHSWDVPKIESFCAEAGRSLEIELDPSSFR